VAPDAISTVTATRAVRPPNVPRVAPDPKNARPRLVPHVVLEVTVNRALTPRTQVKGPNADHDPSVDPDPNAHLEARGAPDQNADPAPRGALAQNADPAPRGAPVQNAPLAHREPVGLRTGRPRRHR
jgi:hypothetical protein